MVAGILAVRCMVVTPIADVELPYVIHDAGLWVNPDADKVKEPQRKTRIEFFDSQFSRNRIDTRLVLC